MRCCKEGSVRRAVNKYGIDDFSPDLYKPSGVREKSRTPLVETKDRMGDSSADLYKPSGVKEKSTTSPAVTENESPRSRRRSRRRRCRKSPTETPLITESASGTRDLVREFMTQSLNISS